MSQTVIKDIETYLVDLPTIRPHHLSMTEMRMQSMVIIRIIYADGTEGVGEATTIGGLSYGVESPESIKLNIDTYFKPLLLNQEADNVNYLMSVINKNVRGNEIAKSGIETALLDAKAKRLSVPLHSLLGGALTDSLPVLWTLASGKTETDIEEAKQLLAEKRHNVFKLKIGWQHPQLAVNHVVAIKKALGDEVKITVDVNQAWSESTAKQYIGKLQDGGVDLIEQPIPAANIEGMARLTQQFSIPIMADESLGQLPDAYKLAQLRSTDVFALKIGKSGGLYETQKQAAIAEASGIELYGGTLLEGTIGSMASAHVFSTLKNMSWGTELFGPLLLTDDIVKESIEFHDFSLHLTDKPGLGLELDMDKINKYKRK